ncbi:MAG: hypothetical protein U1F06_03840 [Steroidobacteraceae bacterium]
MPRAPAPTSACASLVQFAWGEGVLEFRAAELGEPDLGHIIENRRQLQARPRRRRSASAVACTSRDARRLRGHAKA